MRPPAIVTGPRPVSVLGLLLVTTLTTAFGNSLQSISVLVWLQPFVLLLTYEGSIRTFRSSLIAHVIVILAQALGFTVAFAGTLSYPSTTLYSLLDTFGLGTALAASTTLCALLPASRLSRLAAELLPPPPPAPTYTSNSFFPTAPPPTLSLNLLGHVLLVLPVWAFPILQSAVFTLAGTQIGHFHEPGVALADWPPLAQLASIIGLWGRGSGGGAAAEATSRWSRLYRPLRRHILGVACVSWLLVVVGGGLVYSDSFYQRPVGDRIVLWAEEAVRVRNSAEEAALLAAGRDLLVTHGSSGPEDATYLGLCYEKPLLLNEDDLAAGAEQAEGAVSSTTTDNSRTSSSSSNRSNGDSSSSGSGSSSSSSSDNKSGAAVRTTNNFVLLGPNGTTLWSYRKAFPVPILEARVVPGPRHLPTAASPYGTLGGAICFDMDRPQFVRQAGVAGVDLLLQPSWTWGAVGPRHFASDALRAVENGFTTFRCSSDGVSGVVSPHGAARQYLLTGTRDLLTLTLPLQPRVRTPYVAVGWLLEWVNVGLAAALLALLVAVPRRRLADWVVQPRRGAGAALTGGYQQQQQQQQEPLLGQV
ncbi:hypothetical protein VOLCADRAFT_127377 [Volvox carteri f. nagariensis]|uniref:CN hydrolase domain-containing protein n=1 Tax=Volvox carteri f. nagariensis TaxID=3068 RepID=D8THJ8_VOLCA|nr:uncharacterized protein VOLCADRAFT_127377 [Volvox carteri f. nagariensis]EFJ53082.1 hypothetical protein VOLCADRAFT_127377 [Volvox carteri f. nagariensis]|eukprot:XP_002946087.1 hypothetical protein VOLCADRAFT_127377 [Volvox carteri f. nagariensis]